MRRFTAVAIAWAVGCADAPESENGTDAGPSQEAGSPAQPPAGDAAGFGGPDGARVTADGAGPGRDGDAFAVGNDSGLPPPPGLDASVPPPTPDGFGTLPPPEDAGAPGPSLPPPAAQPPAPPPDESAVVFGLAGERPDLLANSCVAQGGTNEFLFEVVRRLRARDPRWGFVLRGGVLLPDRVGYFWADGQPEGRGELYILDIIASHCARPGVDNPPAPAWQDDTAGGGTWTVAPLSGEPLPPAPDAGPGPVMHPLPDHAGVLQQLAGERPDLLAASCVDQGGNNEFLFEGVRRLRALDPRWGLNWKRGNVGDMSQDAIDYFWAEGDPEGRTEVYILDVIGGHCGDNPQAAWIDVTQATLEGGTIGRWTIQPLP